MLLGNVIVKDPKCGGNHAVIHFGQDGGKPHDGTLHLAFNTVVTHFISPVVELSAAGAKARLLGNVVASGIRQAGQKVAGVRNGAAMQNIGGESNWFCGDFSAQETGLDSKGNHFEALAGDLFLGPHDDNYRLPPQAAQRMTVASTAELLELPSVPGLPDTAILRPLDWQYHHPAGREKRPAEQSVTAGAFARPAGRHGSSGTKLRRCHVLVTLLAVKSIR